MILTILLVSTFVLWAAWLFGRYSDDPAKLGVRYLFLIPFFPTTFVINHNLENRSLFDPAVSPIGVWGNVVLIAPLYAVLVLISASLWRVRRELHQLGLGVEGWLLVAYAALSLPSAILGIDPFWGLFGWSWCAPSFLAFYLVGRLGGLQAVVDGRYAYLASLAIVGVNLSFIVLAFGMGRASSILETRSYGSLYASNSALTLFLLFAGSALLQAKKHPAAAAILVGAALITGFTSLSKTAFILLAYLVAAILLGRVIPGWKPKAALAGAFVVVLAGLFFAAPSELRESTFETWAVRLSSFSESGTGAAEEFMSERVGEFETAYGAVLGNPNPLLGVGMGNYPKAWYEETGYSNPHNLFMHESAENGLIPALLLAALFVVGGWSAVRRLGDGDAAPMALSALAFLLLAHTTGSEMAIRALNSYMTPTMGAILCFYFGVLSAPSPAPTSEPASGTSPDPAQAI